jgi:mannose-1-phosphate guanylyltransferase
MVARTGPQTCLDLVDVLVLAGGLGTRIRSVLGETPKLLAPIGDRRYIDLLFDWLRRFGARRVVLALGYGAEAICRYIESHPASDLNISSVVEPSPLGTAGAVRFARSSLHSDPVVVINGDTLIDADLCALLARHRAAAGLGTLLCANVDDAGRYGRLVLNDSGHITGFVEKDPNFRGAAVVSAGVYVLSGALLDEIAAGNATSIEYDVFQKLPAATLAGHTDSFEFLDIGTPESLSAANRSMAK